METSDTKPIDATGRQAEKPAAPMEIACARLKAAGLRVTRPRLAILSALLKRGRPSSMEQIHAELGRTRCDLVTVYRCMAAFEEIGVVRRACLPGGPGHYCLDIGEGRRFHVLCRRTGRLEEIDPGPAEELGRALERVEQSLREKGYAELGRVVDFFGIAPG